MLWFRLFVQPVYTPEDYVSYSECTYFLVIYASVYKAFYIQHIENEDPFSKVLRLSFYGAEFLFLEKKRPNFRLRPGTA